MPSNTGGPLYYAGQRRLCGSYDHMAAQCHQRQGRREQAPPTVERQLGSLAPGTGEAASQATGSWSEEVDRAELELGACATLPVGTVSERPSTGAIVDRSDLQQDGLLDKVLKDFLGEVEDSQEGEKDGRALEGVAAAQECEDTLCNESKQHTVVVEVHQEDMDAEATCGGGTRKQAAGTSDMEDVLTPGQRSGKKPWKTVLDLPGNGGTGSVVLQGLKEKGGIRGLDRPSDKRGYSQQPRLSSNLQKRRGKPPLL
nr:uncharacterized protein LOC128695875 [Cherax quadricarinatus]